MPYTEFFCDPVSAGASNLNGGGLATNAEPAAAPAYNGVGDSDGTNVFTPSDGSTPASSVNVGDWGSVYVTAGATVAVFVGRVTNVAAGVNGAITFSTVAKTGAFPASSGGAHTITCRVGGRWVGPNGAVAFPFNFINKTSTDANSDPVRVNFKNNGTYSITAAMTITSSANFDLLTFQGYSSAPGDGGRATIDGGASGTGYVLLTVGALAVGVTLRDLIFQNNGNSGTSAGLSVASTSCYLERVLVNNVRGAGINGVSAVLFCQECEVYGANQSNTASVGGFTSNSGMYLFNCVSHHNTTANAVGFMGPVNTAIRCVADSNGSSGFQLTAASVVDVDQCVAFNNGGDGINCNQGGGVVRAENCIFDQNGGWGVNQTTAFTTAWGRVIDCAFYNNTSGQVRSNLYDVSGSITLSGDPFVSPANGNFGLNGAAAGASCRAAGRGNLPQTSSSLSGSVTGATNANPIVITTSANHGLASGATVTIASVGGNTNANGTWTVTVLSPTTFSIPVAGNANYTSGGTWSATAYGQTTTAYPDVGAAQHQDSGGGGAANRMSMGIC
jgi:hypothetical protein